MLSGTSRYALRAMLELASLLEATSVMGKDLSRLVGVPSNYFPKSYGYSAERV